MAAPKHGQLVQGEEYLSVVCPSCENIVPIAPAGELYMVAARKITIGCPFCGNSAELPLDTAENRTLEILPPTTQ